jgi:hypothetical protein
MQVLRSRPIACRLGRRALAITLGEHYSSSMRKITSDAESAGELCVERHGASVGLGKKVGTRGFMSNGVGSEG